MLSQPLALMAAAATLCLAKTPAGFEPASNADLVVDFPETNTTALNGVTISKQASASQPRIGTTKQLTGTSYTVLMIDLDIPTANGSSTNTLLHWMQSGLTPSTAATALNTANGTQSVFFLQNSTQVPPAASYLGPNPPAKKPLSHRYTQILVDTSDVGTEATSALQTAATSRMGFQAQAVLQKAGLENKVVAGNFFVVKNSGSTQGGGSGTTGSGSSPTSSSVSGSAPVSEAGSVGVFNRAILSLVAASFLFLTL